MYYTTTYLSPVGVLTLASNGEELVCLWIEGQKYFGEPIGEEMIQKDDLPVFDKTRSWLDRYFKGCKPDPHELPLAPIGSEFRQKVWSILCLIPYGEVTTYGDIAKQMAEKLGKTHMASQAVGGAVGHNPISLIIPCHRVVGSNRSLTGYAGGIAIKEQLLKHEGIDVSRFSIPQKGTAL